MDERRHGRAGDRGPDLQAIRACSASRASRPTCARLRGLGRARGRARRSPCSSTASSARSARSPRRSAASTRLVFTGGIGENDAQTRAARSPRAAPGSASSSTRRATTPATGRISADESRRRGVWVVPTDEERMIARHTVDLLARPARRAAIARGDLTAPVRTASRPTWDSPDAAPISGIRPQMAPGVSVRGPPARPALAGGADAGVRRAGQHVPGGVRHGDRQRIRPSVAARARLSASRPQGSDRRAFMMRSALATAIVALTGRPIAAFAQQPPTRQAPPGTPPRRRSIPSLDVVKQSQGPGP